MEPQPIGGLLDSLDVTADLDEGDLVSSAVVVLSVLKDGVTTPQLCIANSDGMGWIEQAGLLRLAERICSEPPQDRDEDE